MKQTQLFNAIAIILATSGLVACGGGGGGDDSTTTTASKFIGTVDGFGSVYVNGVEFETDSASYDVDDDTNTSQSDLAVGMKVKIEGTVNDDGVTGTANSIYYDDDVEGPIDSRSMTADATIKTFTVLGMTVQVDANTTVFDDGATFDNLAEGNNIEVSGYFDGNQIVATRIELQLGTDDKYEIKGTVESYNGSILNLRLQNDVISSYPVSSSVNSEISAGDSGQFVEVKLEDTGSGLLAIEIELDDDDLLDENEDYVDLYGVLTGDYRNGFMINDVELDLSNSLVYEPTTLEGNLIEGMKVEVEGAMVDGKLIVDEISSEDEGEIEIEAGVRQVVATDNANGTITLDLNVTETLNVISDNSTLLEDESNLDTNGDGSFTLTELTDADYIEAEVYQSGTDLIASKIKRKEVSDETTLEAPFDGHVPDISITLLGITYSLDAQTTYKIDDAISNHDAFFLAVEVGDIVKVKGSETDGTADEVELDSTN